MTTAESTAKDEGGKKETEFTPLEKDEIEALRAFSMGMLCISLALSSR